MKPRASSAPQPRAGASRDALPELVERHVASCVRGHGTLARSVKLPPLDPTLRPGVSVAICTHRRAASLRRLLDSIASQTRLPDAVLVIDASPDTDTEMAIRREPAPWDLGDRLLYVRVGGPLRGLTKQRNVAISLMETDLVAFFDDDIVLEWDCLRELEEVHRTSMPPPVGVAARIVNEQTRPSSRWRLRRLLGIVPTLRPGRYCRSGMSIPWAFAGPTEAVVEGEWLPGGATMWRTQLARTIRFYEGFRGYGNGEDVEFSLRAGACGRLLVAGRAQVKHLQDDAGRPDTRAMAYDSARNAYYIHGTCLVDRSWLDVAYFIYAFAVDTMVLALATLLPGDRSARWRFVQGRLGFLLDLACNRLTPNSARVGRWTTNEICALPADDRIGRGR